MKHKRRRSRERRERGAALSAPLYTDRERAALASTEAVTLVSQTCVPDDVYEEVRNQVSEEELVKLTIAVAMINGWNRIAIRFRAVHPIHEAHAA